MKYRRFESGCMDRDDRRAGPDDSRILLSERSRAYREKVLEGLGEGSYGYSGNLYLDILAVRHPDSDIACRDTIRQCVGETLKRAETCGCSEESEGIIRTLYALSMDYMAIPTSVGAARNMLDRIVPAIERLVSEYHPLEIRTAFSTADDDIMIAYDPPNSTLMALRSIRYGMMDRTGACSTEQVTKKSRRLYGRRKDIRKALDDVDTCISCNLNDSLPICIESYIDLICSNGRRERSGKGYQKKRGKRGS